MFDALEVRGYVRVVQEHSEDNVEEVEPRERWGVRPEVVGFCGEIIAEAIPFLTG